MYNKMIDLDNVFGLFASSDDDADNRRDTAYLDFKDTPIYWVGMYKKLILNHINFNKKVLRFFKEANHELDVKDIKEAGEFVTYNRAWSYITKIDLNDPAHILALEQYSDEYLDTSLELGINFFEEIEEYEKCAHLKKILDKSKEFIS